MATKKPNNPFSSSTYIGAEYFCDRKEETKTLLSNIHNGSSITLLAIRRIGKTGLIKHVFNSLPKGYNGIYIDILNTENISQFLNQISTALLGSVTERSSLGKKIWNFFKSLRPAIGFDALTGSPYATFEVQHESAELNIASILKFLDSTGEKFVIAIDEFQQITNYPEKNCDAFLRTQIQSLKNISFIFSGSQQHLMLELFSMPQRPFYRSTEIIKLDKISQEEYASFIHRMFANYGKTIDIDSINNILAWTETHTYYVQNLCKHVFAASQKQVEADVWKKQALNILKEQDIVFMSYRNILTRPQWQLIKAIAKENYVYQPTAKEFLNRNNLGTSATVLRSLESLKKFELIYTDYNSDGEKYYSIYDVWFKRWIEHR